ncbi:hypothetical protein R5R35_004332 [Gryllus longicercus]|uniref:Centrosomal protein of 19 kDa n=1 Tax=Gryllus longicercus TaxID=2509291 RepID=A0AAN9VEF3_9ORTH|nr:Centrosomal protein of 19 kDa [Gryllus bimaculatus]
MSGIYVPLKCGIKFSPPAVVILYEDTVKKKHRKYIMPLRNFRASSNVNFIAEDLKARHNKVLESIPLLTVEKMLRLLQENIKGVELDKALDLVNKEFSVCDDEDLNKLNAETIRRKKEIMDMTFNKNRVKPTDPNFVYDKRVDFSESEKKRESGWDTEDVDDDFWNVS